MQSVKKIFKNIEKLSKKQVFAGIPFESGNYDSGESVYNVALKNELGDEITPARPFIEQTLKENKTKYSKMMKQNIMQQKDNFDIIKNELIHDIQKKILDFNEPPNAPATIESKGFNDPLIDSGKFFDSVKGGVK